MRRLLASLAAVAATVLVVVLSAPGGPDTPAGEYVIELDNAFGLIEGGDFKVAGVRAGVIESLALDRRTRRALVGVRIDADGFGSLRRDVRCESRPQSLIGEYFVDCLPGTAREVLPAGSRIPVGRTASTIAPDLVNTVLRRPYRERLSLILGELGAAAAGNGANLNEALRRASPAIRETNRVLASLATQNRVLADLARDADAVVGDLVANRKDVGRFVVEAKETATASAARERELAGGFRELPGFLERLAPTMNALGRTADAQRPALRDLQASAGQLERFFGNLGPFADASRPAFKALGRASAVGREAMTSARPIVDLLRRFATGTPELAKNLAIVLEHLDDRDFAVDPQDTRHGVKGLTGLEALLTYVYDQTLSTNVYDSAQHYLKISVFSGECAAYRDAKAVREDAALEKHCGGRVGPNAYGVNYPDPTAGPEPAAARARDKRSPDRRSPKGGAPGTVPAFEDPRNGGDAPAPEPPKAPGIRLPGIDIPDLVPGLPDVPEVELPSLGPEFLDFLLGD